MTLLMSHKSRAYSLSCFCRMFICTSHTEPLHHGWTSSVLVLQCSEYSTCQDVVFGKKCKHPLIFQTEFHNKIRQRPSESLKKVSNCSVLQWTCCSRQTECLLWSRFLSIVAQDQVHVCLMGHMLILFSACLLNDSVALIPLKIIIFVNIF